MSEERTERDNVLFEFGDGGFFGISRDIFIEQKDGQYFLILKGSNASRLDEKFAISPKEADSILQIFDGCTWEPSYVQEGIRDGDSWGIRTKNLESHGHMAYPSDYKRKHRRLFQAVKRITARHSDEIRDPLELEEFLKG